MKNKRILPLALVGVCLLTLAACVFIAGTVCPTGGIFGFPCPLCGMSRAMLHAVNGDIAASFDANPALVPALIGVGTLCPIILRRIDKKPVSRLWYLLFALCAAICVLVYIVRMITLYPDHPVMSVNEKAILLEIKNFFERK